MRTFGKATPGALFTGLALLLGSWISGTAIAAEAGNGPDDPGFKKCVRCHDETSEHPVLSILLTKHGMVADSRTPMADDACVTCHGPSVAHIKDDEVLPDITFEEKDAEISNGQCQSCHNGKQLMHWQGSRHEAENLRCIDCHSVHVAQDPVLDKTMQPDVCLTCHQDQRAAMTKPFRHPIREGEMSCTGCHNPHGSMSQGNLARNTVNETCNNCHADKRGPMLWEHQPVTEDCTICHSPHGSVHAGMLKQRGPWLCQTCHLANQHPSTAYSGTGLPTATRPSGAQQMLHKNCLNCHGEVHGSNHPSGPRFTR